MGELKIAVVCSSNFNRSMEAHAVLARKNFKVASFGTGQKVRIPGPTKNEPNSYSFGENENENENVLVENTDTTYEEIFQDLMAKDRKLYTENGMLHLVDRNRRIKEKPERFSESPDRFDLIITVEEKVYDNVLAIFEETHNVHHQPAHVINIDVIDNPEDATIGAFLLCELVELLSSSNDLDDEIDEILQEFEARSKRPVMHTVAFY